MRAGRLPILGVPLDRIGRQEALSRLFLTGQSLDPGLFTVTTLNPEYVMAARLSPVFRESIERSDLIVCDGVGVLISARLIHGKRASSISRLTGTELTMLLARWSAFNDSGGLFLLGGKNAVSAARTLAQLEPNARIAGAWSGGSAHPMMDDESIHRIQASGASIVLVAYGAPDQLAWIERNRPALVDAGVSVAIGVGGVFDYLSGDAVLAPAAIRRAGLEWLYRLIREPWRVRRQSVLPVFALLVAWEALRVRRLMTSSDGMDSHAANGA